jgi:hydrogenase maturation protein HypF
MGRLFDAASALMGIRQTATYEGQAAVEMEALADTEEQSLYVFDRQAENIDPTPLWEALLADWRSGTRIPVLAARFHNSIARLAVDLCVEIRRESGCQTAALSGGVWLNRLLLERTVPLLQQQGFQVLIHRQVPPNDGGIALGQVMVAAYQFKKE